MDIERTIEFLLAQQARFEERQQRHDERQAQFKEGMLQIMSVLLNVATSQERTMKLLRASGTPGKD